VTSAVKMCTEELYGKLLPTAYLYCVLFIFMPVPVKTPWM